jgi:serine/threonine-protein kinase RsbW
MESVTQTVEIPSTVDEIHRVQAVIQHELSRQGYDADTCFAVKLALEESLVNAVKHGNKFDPKCLVHVRFSINPRRISISVKDEGSGFDPTGVPDPTSDENLTKPNGRGIMLMRAYMDEVSYNRRGNEVTMIRRKR